MDLVFRILLFVAGAINFAPSLLVFLPQKISDSYGITVPNVDLELLLRHRAVLFGIVGGLMIYSSLAQRYYSVSVIVGLISMASFLVLYFLIGGINEELERVMKVDAIAIVLLVVGFGLYKFHS